MRSIAEALEDAKRGAVERGDFPLAAHIRDLIAQTRLSEIGVTAEATLWLGGVLSRLEEAIVCFAVSDALEAGRREIGESNLREAAWVTVESNPAEWLGEH